MNTVSADHLLPDELAALMHFYAEAGVSWLSEDEPIDRFVELAEQASRRSVQTARPQPDGAAPAATANRLARTAAAPATGPAPPVSVPDAEAVEAARSLAASADTPEALVGAVQAFTACNLKFSARHTVFAAGDLEARVIVIGGMPASEDDREGRPFSGSAGQMLARMVSGIGIDPDALLTANVIPWRTPGDRAPTVREVDICRPFALRLVELVRPEAVLVLGNLPARVLSDGPRAGIHVMRGKWFGLSAGAAQVRAFATFHPQEMLATPTCKRLAWQDMMRFGAELGGGRVP